MDTKELLDMDYGTFKEFVTKEVTEGHGRLRPEISNHLNSKAFVHRLWPMIFVVRRDLEKANERYDYAMTLAGRICTVELICKLDGEDLQSLVNSEVRRVEPNRVRTMLCDPALIEQWRLCLVIMKKSVESQMGSKADEVAALLSRINSPGRNVDEQGMSDSEVRKARIEAHRQAHEKLASWRSGAKRFKLSIEERLVEIQKTQLRREEEPENPLAVAIARHKRKLLSEVKPEDIDDADRELWAAAESATA